MSTGQSPCFISDSRVCQASSPKNVVFIIGSSSREFKEDISVIKEVLNGFNLIGYFALWSEKEIGLDAFCDKICKKIREARFCIALLNNPVIKDKDRNTSEIKRAPSANVYFEFGMAIALEKPVIPIIRHDLKLPFDVRQLDTIIYDDLSDLRNKLKNSVLPILSKKKEVFMTKTSKLVEKIYEPLSSILEKHVNELKFFGNLSTYEVVELLGKETYYKMQMPQDLLKRLNNYIEHAEALYRKEHEAREVMIDVLSRITLEFLNKPYSPQGSNLKIEFEAISKRGSKTDLHSTLIFRLLLENRKIEEFLEEDRWFETYEQIAIKSRFSNEIPTVLGWTEFNKEIWNKCLAEVSANSKVLQFKKSAKSLLEDVRTIIDEIVKS